MAETSPSASSGAAADLAGVGQDVEHLPRARGVDLRLGDARSGQLDLAVEHIQIRALLAQLLVLQLALARRQLLGDLDRPDLEGVLEVLVLGPRYFSSRSKRSLPWTVGRISLYWVVISSKRAFEASTRPADSSLAFCSLSNCSRSRASFCFWSSL